MRRLLLAPLFTLTLTTCVPPIETPLGRWAAHDKPLNVSLSTELATEPDCLAAIDAALTFWSRQGVTWGSLRWGSGELRPGWVVVRRGQVNPPVLAQTHVHSERSTGRIRGAEVVLGACDARVVAHEIGHALGLGHHWAQSNVMFPTTTPWQAWGVTAEQRDVVGRPAP